MDELMIKAISELNEEKVLKLVRDCLKNQFHPNDIIAMLQLGMDKIGEYYEKNEYYITDLIMAGIIFKEVLELEGMSQSFSKTKSRKYVGRMVIGTVKGDMHDIGKNIVIDLAEYAGFEVFDLGVDITPEVFCDKVRECNPDILGLSGVLTLAVDSMKEIVEALNEQNLRSSLKIIVGGNMINEVCSDYIGADAYSKDASSGMKICKEWIMYPHRSREN